MSSKDLKAQIPLQTLNERLCSVPPFHGGVSSLFQIDPKNKMFDWIHFHWAHYSPAKPIESNPHKPIQNGYFQGDWQRLGFYVGRKRDQSSKPFTFFWVNTPNMVPDIHSWEIDTLARVNPGDWSLVFTKVAFVCLFQNASYSLHFLDVRLPIVSIDRGYLFPFLNCRRGVQRLVQLAVPQDLRLLRLLWRWWRLFLSSLLQHESARR